MGVPHLRRQSESSIRQKSGLSVMPSRLFSLNVPNTLCSIWLPIFPLELLNLVITAIGSPSPGVAGRPGASGFTRLPGQTGRIVLT